ncbi:MAG: 2-C-methyl-D-erythritol 4-phosphate cytidylyltransferase [Bacteroidetes bacterium]|nr:2-C-methyl-D-erythritol 4-phosphate cytidylyltransferase [Bacteroidota bacterium]
MKHYAIIVAGGTGTRMKSGTPKQFILLGGKPLLMHTIQQFYKANSSIEIIIVLPGNEIPAWNELCKKNSFSIAHEIVAGGSSRFQSVKNGLALIKEKSIVAVHDGARPFVSEQLINDCYSAAEKNGNAVPAIRLNESIRKIQGDKNENADRNSFVIVQTPQCFDSDNLREAYQSVEQNFFTDDASVVEFGGTPIHLLEGEPENIKITYPFDLFIAGTILEKRKQEK